MDNGCRHAPPVLITLRMEPSILISFLSSTVHSIPPLPFIRPPFHHPSFLQACHFHSVPPRPPGFGGGREFPITARPPAPARDPPTPPSPAARGRRRGRCPRTRYRLPPARAAPDHHLHVISLASAPPLLPPARLLSHPAAAPAQFRCRPSPPDATVAAGAASSRPASPSALSTVADPSAAAIPQNHPPTAPALVAPPGPPTAAHCRSHITTSSASAAGDRLRCRCVHPITTEPPRPPMPPRPPLGGPAAAPFAHRHLPHRIRRALSPPEPGCPAPPLQTATCRHCLAPPAPPAATGRRTTGSTAPPLPPTVGCQGPRRPAPALPHRHRHRPHPAPPAPPFHTGIPIARLTCRHRCRPTRSTPPRLTAASMPPSPLSTRRTRRHRRCHHSPAVPPPPPAPPLPPSPTAPPFRPHFGTAQLGQLRG